MEQGKGGGGLWRRSLGREKSGAELRGVRKSDWEEMCFPPAVRSSPTSSALGSGAPDSGSSAVPEGPGRVRRSGPSGPPGIRSSLTHTETPQSYSYVSTLRDPAPPFPAVRRPGGQGERLRTQSLLGLPPSPLVNCGLATPLSLSTFSSTNRIRDLRLCSNRCGLVTPWSLLFWLRLTAALWLPEAVPQCLPGSC